MRTKTIYFSGKSLYHFLYVFSFGKMFLLKSASLHYIIFCFQFFSQKSSCCVLNLPHQIFVWGPLKFILIRVGTWRFFFFIPFCFIHLNQQAISITCRSRCDFKSWFFQWVQYSSHSVIEMTSFDTAMPVELTLNMWNFSTQKNIMLLSPSHGLCSKKTSHLWKSLTLATWGS